MNKRQRERTNKLIQFIKNNPNSFNQWESTDCIIGLGNRLVCGKLQPHQEIERDFFAVLAVQKFAERYGISFDNADYLFLGRFSQINRRQKDMDLDKSSVKSAVSVLTYLTKQ
jgi:hypothetical protein